MKGLGAQALDQYIQYDACYSPTACVRQEND